MLLGSNYEQKNHLLHQTRAAFTIAGLIAVNVELAAGINRLSHISVSETFTKPIQ